MATRETCAVCGLRCRAESGVCPTCRLARDGSQARRPAAPCSGECGRRTTAKDGWCRICRPTYMKQGPIKYDHAVWVDAAPGDWKLIRGVRRWVPKKEKVA